MDYHETINYLELPCKDFERNKAFFSEVFGWEFVDFDPDYMAFSGKAMRGGFYLSDKVSLSSKTGAALIVFYSHVLEDTAAKIKAAGGIVVEPVEEFPGGRRFHFFDPHGNEYAVWSAT